MGNWIKNPGTGENPIPGAKAGEFELRFRDGVEVAGIFDAEQLYWGIDSSDADVLAYCLIDKEHILSSN